MLFSFCIQNESTLFIHFLLFLFFLLLLQSKFYILAQFVPLILFLIPFKLLIGFLFPKFLFNIIYLIEYFRFYCQQIYPLSLWELFYFTHPLCLSCQNLEILPKIHLKSFLENNFDIIHLWTYLHHLYYYFRFLIN